jgi:1-acyl-sn-glycerol-3-phosphate acyltransferase
MEIIGAVLRVLAAWIVTIVYWPIVLLIYVLSFKQLPHRFTTGAIRLWGKSLLWLLGIRLECVNESTLADRQGRVVIINHQSALDVLWTAATAAPAAMAIGKKEVIFIPIINLAWWALGFVRVDRKNHTKALAALAGVGEKIHHERRALYIAVEGTRTRDGNILRFKKGAFHIAHEAHVPICPVVVDGAFQLLPRNAFFPKKGVIRLLFLPPVSAEEVQQAVTHDQLDVLIEKVRGDMIQGLERIRRS